MPVEPALPSPIAPSPPDGPFEPVAAERVVSGTPATRFRSDYTSADGRVDAGIWESTAGAWRVRYDEVEICTILAGRVRLEPDSGTAQSYDAGESFAVPAGFAGVWVSLEPVRKLYVIVT